MERKVKYNYEFKLRCVKEVLNDHQTVKAVSESNGFHHTTLHDWVRAYETFGKKGLVPRKTKKYSLEFKHQVLESIEKDVLSLSQACMKYRIPTKSVIMGWQRKYKNLGAMGLTDKPKGKPDMPFKRAKKKPNRPLTREEELLLENESLRAELDLLKKLEALIQAERNRKLKP